MRNGASFRAEEREYVESIEEAKKPETRQRRIDRAVQMIAARPAKASADGKQNMRP